MNNTCADDGLAGELDDILRASDGIRAKSAQELSERVTAQAKRIEGLMATETSLRAENERLRKEIEEQAVQIEQLQAKDASTIEAWNMWSKFYKRDLFEGDVRPRTIDALVKMLILKADQLDSAVHGSLEVWNDKLGKRWDETDGGESKPDDLVSVVIYLCDKVTELRGEVRRVEKYGLEMAAERDSKKRWVNLLREELKKAPVSSIQAVQINQQLRSDNEAMAARIERIEEIGKKLQDENVRLRQERHEQAVREARLRRECDESADQIGDLKEQLERERAEHHKTSDAFGEECRKNDLLKQELEEARAKSPTSEREYEARLEREAARSFLHRRYGHIENWTGHPRDSDDECPLVKMLEAALKLEAAGHDSDAAERAWAMHAEVTKVLAKYMAEVEKAK